MKTSHIILLVIFGLFFLGGCGAVGTYNSMVSSQESVTSAWSQVENVYQRRADLIPNLVETVRGYANFERSTLTDVIEARAKATSVTIDPSKMSAEQLKNFQQAQDGLSSTLSKLMVVVEKYPELKANEGFLSLQAQLEGTENRITVERKKFNEASQKYNTYIRKFPNNMLAGMFGFQQKPYFQATEGADKPAAVKF